MRPDSGPGETAWPRPRPAMRDDLDDRNLLSTHPPPALQAIPGGSLLMTAARLDDPAGIVSSR
ncbi:MAG: hypothetical protein Kow0020_02210 [Wenzhouxiangellaceae bacterium]